MTTPVQPAPLKKLGYIPFGTGRTYYLLQIIGGGKYVLLVVGTEHNAGIISGKEAIASINHIIAMINHADHNMNSAADVEELIRERAMAKTTLAAIEQEFA